MKEVNVLLGERVKAVRNEKNFTRERLAELVDVSPRFLADVEAGKVGVSLLTLKKISITLCVTCDYLLGLNDNKNISDLEIITIRLNRIDKKYYPLILKILEELGNC